MSFPRASKMASYSSKPINTTPLPLKYTTTQPNALKPLPKDDTINKFINIFKTTINPVINFGNKTQRNVSEYLIKKFTYDKAVKMAQYAISVQGRPYAPTITTPWELKEKLSKLVVYYHRQKNEELKNKKLGKNYDK